MEQIDELHATGEAYRRRLDELTELSLQHRLANQEFDFYREMLDSFAASMDDSTVEEKRRLLRAIVKKGVWDGENVYVYLFAGEGEADLPLFDAPEVPLGENSKRAPYAASQQPKDEIGSIAERASWHRPGRK